jgi:hypothetical protein
MKNNTSKEDGSSFEDLIDVLMSEPDSHGTKLPAPNNRNVLVVDPKDDLAKISRREESDGHHKRNKQ